MALNKYRLGNIITPYSKKCGIENLTPFQISGINREKEFFEPSHQVGKDTSKYQIVPPGYFACNLMHVGRDKVLPIAYNHSDSVKYVSPAYTIFTLNKNSGVLNEYFFMMLKSKEQDRYFWFHADASVRDGMSWGDFCNVDIIVPNIQTQKRYVNMYKAMVANQQSYERGLEDLKLVCDGYIEDLRRKMPCEKIEPYIKAVGEKNSDNQITLEQGININKEFITPQRSNSDLSSRVIVRKGQIAYCTQLNNANVAIALREGDDCVVSPVYSVIEVIDKNKLLPQYLMLWLIRPEWGRFVYWAATGSAYEFVQYESVCNTEIPIPDIKTQQRIVDIFNVYKTRKQINEKLKSQIKNICPILIRGSLEEK